MRSDADVSPGFSESKAHHDSRSLCLILGYARWCKIATGSALPCLAWPKDIRPLERALRRRVPSVIAEKRSSLVLTVTYITPSFSKALGSEGVVEYVEIVGEADYRIATRFSPQYPCVTEELRRILIAKFIRMSRQRETSFLQAFKDPHICMTPELPLDALLHWCLSLDRMSMNINITEYSKIKKGNITAFPSLFYYRYQHYNITGPSRKVLGNTDQKRN
jgi:hypothetical protein